MSMTIYVLFARGWMTGGKSVRAAQMLNLHRLDLPYYMEKSIEKDLCNVPTTRLIITQETMTQNPK